MSLLQNITNRLKHPQKEHRLPRVQSAIQVIISRHQDTVDRERDLEWEYEHIQQSIKYAKMLALRRKIDTDLAACAVALQNIGRITTGKSQGHAEAGYEQTRKMLRELGCFTISEVEQIANSVKRHNDKSREDGPLDELSKDVDVYVRYVQGIDVASHSELHRLAKVRLELQQTVK